MVILSIVLGVICVGALVAVAVLWARLRRAQLYIVQLESAAIERRHRKRAPTVVRRATKVVKAVAESTQIVRDHGVGGLIASSLDDFDRWVFAEREEIRELTAADGTVTIMFSDIEGSTSLNDELGDKAWMKILSRHDDIVRAAIARHHGHVVKNQGDGFMVVFTEPGDALSAAIRMHRNLAGMRGKLMSTPIAIRIGMHRGAVVARDGDFYGLNVAMAARIAAEAQGKETLVSEDVRDVLAERSAFAFTDPIEVSLKGVSQPQLLWRAWPSKAVEGRNRSKENLPEEIERAEQSHE